MVIAACILLTGSCLLSVNGTDETIETEIENIPFVVTCPKEDGANGYYTRYPVIKVQHKDPNHITKYKVSTANKEEQEGTLYQLNEVMNIEQGMLGEGTNELQVWMEDKEGNVLEVEHYIKQIKIDTRCATAQVLAPQGFQSWYGGEVAVTVTASDGEQGSGMNKIECVADGEKVGEINGGSGLFIIQKMSTLGRPVRIKIFAHDIAGNVSSVEKELYIDRLIPDIQIVGMEHFMITSQPKEISYVVKDENVLQEFGAITKWKKQTQEVEELLNGEWQEVEAGKKMMQSIREDGVYQMKLYAIDAAGNKSVTTSQLIVDQTNPTISYVEELNNSYCKEFVWDYKIEEVIKDLTSYTYEVLLDENLYEKGKKITQEGRHILKVKATDAAGNKAMSAATFVIDRTSPKILFLDIEQAGIYEKEKKFRIQTKETEDEIISVKINGEERRNQKGNVYQTEKEGEYLIEVVAKDKAENISESKFFFQIVPKKNVVNKVVDNIKITLGIMKERENPETEKKEEPQMLPYVLLYTTGILSMVIAMFVIRLRKE